MFYIPASVKSLKNYVTGSRKTFNDTSFLLNSTKVPRAIHAFVNVFLSGIHSRLEQDLRIYLSPWHVSFLPKLRPRWLLPLHYFVLQSFLNTHTLTKRLTVLACSDNNKNIRTPSVFDFWLILP